jgi:uncharacterized protein
MTHTIISTGSFTIDDIHVTPGTKCTLAMPNVNPPITTDSNLGKQCRAFLAQLIRNVKTFCTINNLDESHGYMHFMRVLQHASNACKCENIEFVNKFAILIASLLHDVDDAKYFSTEDFANARNLLSITIDMFGVNLPEFITNDWVELVINMIKLVSCSKNGNKLPDETPQWMFIPRLADRLDALGEIGIERTIAFNNMKGRPMHDKNTKRAYTIDELNNIATLDRFNQYVNGNTELTTIGHMYDKLIHIGRPEYFGTTNKYLIYEANKGRIVMEQFVLKYWKDLHYD